MAVMSTKPPCVLAVDVGSSAVRAALIGEGGQSIAAHRIERTDAHSGLTFDAEALWHDVAQSIAALQARQGATVVGLGVAAHIGTVPVTASLEPTGQAAGWASHAGSGLFAAGIEANAARTLASLGRPAVTGGALPALVSLRHTDAAQYSRVRHVLSPKDFIVARLTGTVITDATSAAYTLASIVAERSWSTALIESFGVDPGMFPRQVAATDVVGGLKADMADRLNLAPGTPVIAGGPDGTVGATLVLGTNRGAVADIAGTTDVLVRLIDNPLSAAEPAVVNPYTSGPYWTTGGPTGMTGGAAAHWASLMSFDSASRALEELESQLGSIPPGSDGLVISPLLSGSRFPRWNPAERGEVHGMTAEHSQAHLLHAAQEGAAYVVREGIDCLSERHDDQVILAGGAARSPRLAQMRADVLGRQVAVSRVPDASLLGTALLTLLGTGLVHDIDDAARQLRGPLLLIDPNPARAARYEELYQSWLSGQGNAAIQQRAPTPATAV
jgi:sugar (pentulose or hexulose) kinase